MNRAGVLMCVVQTCVPCSDEKYKQSSRSAAGADKWLDVRLWESTASAVKAVKVWHTRTHIHTHTKIHSKVQMCMAGPVANVCDSLLACHLQAAGFQLVVTHLSKSSVTLQVRNKSTNHGGRQWGVLLARRCGSVHACTHGVHLCLSLPCARVCHMCAICVSAYCRK